MDKLAPLAVAAPLLAAAFILILKGIYLRRWLMDILAIVAGAVVTAFCLILLARSVPTSIVYWFGGWSPEDNFALGICFTVDPVGAGVASLAAILVTLALVFSWRYMESVDAHYHILMLLFLAAMAGFALTGDLFNMFVFFELMGVAAYALTGLKIEEEGPLQGGLNFAVMNSLGAFMILAGLGLVYARTGALNTAQAGEALAKTRIDYLVFMAFALLAIGFLVKAAVVPFHFWLPDAHAVAPSPVSILFSGVMVELGLYAVARVYWTIFHPSLESHEEPLRNLLLTIGVISSILGGIMCFAQRHLKRLLAFSTVGHVGIILVGIALFSDLGLAGAAVYTLGHGFVKAALFLCVGVLLHRAGSVDEYELHRRGTKMKVAGGAFLIGGLALAGLPPFGTFLGKAMIEEACAKLGYSWYSWVAAFASAMTGGAVLRAGGRIFLGLGRLHGRSTAPTRGNEERETTQRTRATPHTMLLPIVLLMALCLAIGFVENLGGRAEAASHRFRDSSSYVAAVLKGHSQLPLAIRHYVPGLHGWVMSFVSAILAVAVALIALFGHQVSKSARQTLSRAFRPALQVLRDLHSGYIGDYAAWFVFGAAVIAVILAAAA